MVIFHGYVTNNQMVSMHIHDDMMLPALCVDVYRRSAGLTGSNFGEQAWKLRKFLLGFLNTHRK